MRERVFEDRFIIDVDNNGDNYESFTRSVEFIRQEFNISEVEFKESFFDDAHFHFYLNQVLIKLTFSGFMGTEIEVSNDENEEIKNELKNIASILLKQISAN